MLLCKKHSELNSSKAPDNDSEFENADSMNQQNIWQIILGAILFESENSMPEQEVEQMEEPMDLEEAQSSEVRLQRSHFVQSFDTDLV